MADPPTTPPEDGCIDMPVDCPADQLAYQSSEANHLEIALGNVAGKTETVMQNLADQMDTHSAKVETGTNLIQGVLKDQLTTQLQNVQTKTDAIQQTLNQQMAGQLGKIAETTALVAPNDPTIKAITSVATGTVVGGVAGLAHLPQCSDLTKGMTCSQVAGILGPENVSHNFKDSQGRVNAYYWSHQATKPDGSCILIVYWSGAGGSGSGSYQIDTSTCGPATVPSPSPIVVTPPPTQLPPSSPSPPPTQPLPPYQCPPVTIKFPDCIKFCPEPPKPVPPKPRFCLWCSPKGVLAILSDKDSPPSSDWKNLGCFADPKEMPIGQLTCKKPSEVPPDYPPNYVPPAYTPPSGTHTGCDNLFRYSLWLSQADPNYFRDLLIGVDKANPTVAESGSTLVDGAIASFWTQVAAFAGGALDSIISTLSNTVPLNTSGTSEGAQVVLTRTILSFLARFVPGPIEPLETSLSYAQNELDPFKIPSSEAATAAYITDSISLERLKCIVAANGHRWDSWQDIVDQQRMRWNPAETLMLWRRGFIGQPERDGYLRQLGYLSQKEKDGLAKLTEQIPGPADIVSMMLRDVADEVTIDWTESDRIFKTKYTGDLRKWGEQQGMQESVMKSLWRAHWQLPSPTQLFEFWARLRKTGKYGTEAEFEQKIKNVLLQNDYHPDWINAYMDVALRPLTRIDAGRAFEIGALSKADLKLVYNELGYNDTNADRLVKFKTQKLIQTLKNGTLTTQYAKGEISYQEIDDELRGLGLDSDIVVPVLEYAQKRLKRNTRKSCLSAYRKRYLLGELADNQVGSTLASYGLDPIQVDELTKAWKCEKISRGKVVPMATLCGWYDKGIIDEVELYTRAKTLGYDEDAASKLVKDCMIRTNMRLGREQQKAMLQAKRQAKEQMAMEEKLGQKLQQAADKQAREISKAQKIREDRQKLLIKTGEVWATKTGDDLGNSVMSIKRIINQAIALQIAPINTVYQGAATVASDDAVTDFAKFASELTAVLVDAQ